MNSRQQSRLVADCVALFFCRKTVSTLLRSPERLLPAPLCCKIGLWSSRAATYLSLRGRRPLIGAEFRTALDTSILQACKAEIGDRLGKLGFAFGSRG